MLPGCGSGLSAGDSGVAARVGRLLTTGFQTKERSVPTTTTHDRLADMRRQIEELEVLAAGSGSEPSARIRRQLETLREQQATADATAHRAADAFDEKAEQFEARLRVARSAMAGVVAGSRDEFADAVEDELERWDAYLERLQAQAALRAASARDQAEVEIRDLRRRRHRAAERLADVRAASGETWDEERQRLAAALDELERKADEMSARFG
jgi:hypothetical protein